MPGHFQSPLFQLYVFLGLFIFACKVVALGRAFSRRLINATCNVTKPHHRIRVSQEMREDLKVWLSFLSDYNGSTVMLDSGAPIVGNIDWSIGRHHAIRWSIIIPCGPFWFLVPKIYRLHFILFFFFFFFFSLSHTDKHLAVLSQRTFDTQSIHTFGLVYYLSTARNGPFYIRCYTYGNQCFVLFQVNVYKWKNCSL